MLLWPHLTKGTNMSKFYTVKDRKLSIVEKARLEGMLSPKVHIVTDKQGELLWEKAFYEPPCTCNTEECTCPEEEEWHPEDYREEGPNSCIIVRKAGDQPWKESVTAFGWPKGTNFYTVVILPGEETPDLEYTDDMFWVKTI